MHAKDDENTFLHWAAVTNDTNHLKKLLEIEEINVNAKNKYGDTFLHFAACEGNVEHTQLLLRIKEMNVNIKNLDNISNFR
ncbi:ankyrin repeat domain-containing protein [Candidatus Cardinium hertigii]|uniref:ankyrin repeat domain-containing protein n=1 Tax=Candidatus Cardinium hertigii TaxID=247481 RepID=UPI001FAB08AA|nr:ankyrin repeat domain-containing protein [Candidatus Cardinium hertigii]